MIAERVVLRRKARVEGRRLATSMILKGTVLANKRIEVEFLTKVSVFVNLFCIFLFILQKLSLYLICFSPMINFCVQN